VDFKISGKSTEQCREAKSLCVKYYIQGYRETVFLWNLVFTLEHKID